nr:pentatricopeptide repeat-containing protein At1g52620 [Tanacetum cinerariifolium]
MRNEGEFASCDVLGEVVRVYSQCGLVDKGLEFYKVVLEVYECVPNVYACNALLSGLVKCGRLESACKVYDEMVQRGGADNYSTCIMSTLSDNMSSPITVRSSSRIITTRSLQIFASCSSATAPKREKHAKKRVVITGMGRVSLFANDADVYYERLLAGESGISFIDRFDASKLTTRFGGQIRGFTSSGYIDEKIDPRLDDSQHFIQDVQINKERAGVLVGSVAGGSMVSYEACATSNTCFLAAANYIRDGNAELMIAGGVDACINPITMGGFAVCRALSRRNDDPLTACRPWDQDRDSLDMGEGAGKYDRFICANFVWEFLMVVAGRRYSVLTDGEDPIRAGEIVVFKIDDREIPIIHRVIKTKKDPVYITREVKPFWPRWDDNYQDDRPLYAPGQQWLEHHHIIGRAVGFLPYVGYVTIIMTDYPFIKYALIGALGLLAITSKGKVDEGRKLIVDRWGDGCIPNVVFYNILIDGYCKKGDVKKAFLLFKELKLKGFLPAVETYGAMINGFCKDGNFGIVERLMNEMKSRGLVINVKVYNSIIDAQCRHSCKTKAVEMFRKMIEIGCEPDIITYNILIYDSCRHGKVKEAEQLIEQAARRGLRPNKLSYTPLLNAYCRQNDTDKALDLFVKMIDSGEKPDLLTYQSLIHGIVVLGEVETAVIILEKMTERGVFPDAGVYNVLISGLCKKSKLPAARNMLSRMLDQNIPPDRFIYATLIDGFVRNEELDEAKKLFEHAIQKGVKLDVVGYNAIIKGYCKNGKLNDAVSCVNTMIKARIFPDEFTYSTIIDGYVKQHDMDGALGIFSQMVKQNCKPNVVTYTSLINGFCQKGDTISAEKFLKEMKFRGLMPNVVTYSILIGSYCKIGNLSKAASFFEQMLMNKCNPNDVTFHYLVNGFTKYEKNKEIKEDKNSMFLDINRKMILDGWSPRVAVYSTIVVCLCLHGMLSISLQLTGKMAIRDCPIVFAALLYDICLEGKAKEWNSIITCNLNESELLVAVKYTSIFQQYHPQGAISEASLILQGLVEESGDGIMELEGLTSFYTNVVTKSSLLSGEDFKTMHGNTKAALDYYVSINLLGRLLGRSQGLKGKELMEALRKAHKDDYVMGRGSALPDCFCDFRL